MKAWQPAALALALLVVSACGDFETVPTQAPKEPVSVIEAPSDGPQEAISMDSPTAPGQDPPDDAPPEYQHYTWIDVQADVGWNGLREAYAQAIVRFGGNNASALIELSVKNPQGAVVASNSGIAEVSYLLPLNR